MAGVVECSCGQKLKLPDEAPGRRFRCPMCGVILEAPIAEPVAPPPAAMRPPADGVALERTTTYYPPLSREEPRIPLRLRSPEASKRSLWPWLAVGAAALFMLGLAASAAGWLLFRSIRSPGRPSPVAVRSLPAKPAVLPGARPAAPQPKEIARPDPTRKENPWVPVSLPPPEWLKKPAPDWFPQDEKKRDRLRQARRDWAKRTYSGAYDKLAPKGGKGDAAARRALAWADKKSSLAFRDLISEVELANAAREAVAAGCADPLIGYLRIRWSEYSEPMTPEQRNPLFVKAAWAIHESKYPAARRSHPLANAAVAVMAAPESIPEGRKEMRRLLDASCALLPTILEEPAHEAREEALDLCTPLVAGYMFLGGDRLAAFRKIDAVLEKGKAPRVFRLLLEGRVSINYAWDARGNGVASTVTPEGWNLFRERLQRAETVLEEAWKLDRASPLAAKSMLTVAMGLGYPREQMEVWFRRALQADPDNQSACLLKLLYLEPKWTGSAEEMLKFARECAQTRNTEAEFSLLLPYAHRTLSHYQRNPALYYQDPTVWQDIHAAYEMDLKAKPDSRVVRTLYAKEAYACSQFLVAHEQFKLLGDRPYLPHFANEAEYKQMRDFCIGIHKYTEARKAGRP